MYYLILFAFILLFAWIIFKWARRQWYYVDTDKTKFKTKEIEKAFELLENIDTEKYKEQRDKIEKIKDDTEL